MIICLKTQSIIIHIIQILYFEKYRNPKTKKNQMLQARFDWACSWTVVESARCRRGGLHRIQYLNIEPWFSTNKYVRWASPLVLSADLCMCTCPRRSVFFRRICKIKSFQTVHFVINWIFQQLAFALLTNLLISSKTFYTLWIHSSVQKVYSLANYLP